MIGEESPALGFSQHSALRNPSPARSGATPSSLSSLLGVAADRIVAPASLYATRVSRRWRTEAHDY